MGFLRRGKFSYFASDVDAISWTFRRMTTITFPASKVLEELSLIYNPQKLNKFKSITRAAPGPKLGSKRVIEKLGLLPLCPSSRDTIPHSAAI